jgi:alkylation response protein AidB-like acyl-CoA dehydrogenase
MEMSQHRAGLYAPCYFVFGAVGLAQLYEANEDQKQRFLYPTLRGEKRAFFGLTEPSGGSDPAKLHLVFDPVQNKLRKSRNVIVVNDCTVS